MPELIEVEVYRQLADRLVGASVEEVVAPDAWFVKGGARPADVVAAVEGRSVVATRRHGKRLLVDLAGEGPVLGLRFGMTGRLVLDDEAPIGRLEYSSGRDLPAWDRFELRFAGGSILRISDPRRLGGVELDPDLSVLGPDAWSITVGEVVEALRGSRAPLKARLLDQHHVAGLGNLLVDETLWRASLDPARPAADLDRDECRHLARRIRSTITTLHRRGGSHTGDLQVERHREGRCPRDGAELERRTIGGRTTYSCPLHQG